LQTTIVRPIQTDRSWSLVWGILAGLLTRSKEESNRMMVLVMPESGPTQAILYRLINQYF